MIGKIKTFSQDKTSKQHIYGVKRSTSSSSSAWERLEDSIDLVANATHDGTEVQNDFDSLYPWSDIISYNYSNGEITAYYGDADFSFDGSNGDVFTRIPEFWWMRTQSDGYEYIYIADYAAKDFTYSEAFSLSRYTASGSSSQLYSKSGATPLGSASLNNFRSYAKTSGYRLLDIWAWSKLQMLYLVEYASYNSQSKLGNGNQATTGNAIINSGECDDLGMKSGCLTNDGSHSVIYRGIENIFGNMYQACDGIQLRYSSCRGYVCTDSDSYATTQSGAFSSPYASLSFACSSSSGFIKKIGYDSNYPSLQMPSTVGGSSGTYIPDYFITNVATSDYNTVVWVGGNYYESNSNASGLWDYMCSQLGNTTSKSYGCRLLLDL